MASTFPTANDSLTTSHVDNVGEFIYASTVNDLASAVNAIETTVTATPTATKIPLADGTGKIAVGWLPTHTHTTEFLRGASFPSPVNGDAVTTPMVEATITPTAIRGYRVGGSGATVNVLKNGAAVLGTALSLTSATTWTSVTTGLGTLASGDTVALQVVTVTGGPTEIVVELVGTRSIT